MARMHSRKRGKAGSKAIISDKKPEWVRYTAEEVEALAVKHMKEGLSLAEVGCVLRDTYGIPSVKIVTGKKIEQIAKDNKLSKNLPDDLRALIKRQVTLKKHLELNIHDYSAKRGLQLTNAKIFRLVKYYKGSGKIEADWKFDQSKASFYLE